MKKTKSQIDKEQKYIELQERYKKLVQRKYQ